MSIDWPVLVTSTTVGLATQVIMWRTRPLCSVGQHQYTLSVEIIGLLCKSVWFLDNSAIFTAFPSTSGQLKLYV